ncbi:adenosine deaminase isoform X3 [Callorhinchus milii]|uniref:adenosine deaminase isoform X3 n=1 Tax=Callorhinchus milii TaxID=7868 RepID=UPI0004574156|nr:adenosine deaminase isoform X3 [Callorhinchus milii]XP_007894989.1 adenosine deaminase isoform X3 [Callorhinchus milii]|eukprot:gi/632958357/ref/XP_007894988.1/ PREDICTED: adenosine deaminase-like isoform X3 [Callorhinchus milii]
MGWKKTILRMHQYSRGKGHRLRIAKGYFRTETRKFFLTRMIINNLNNRMQGRVVESRTLIDAVIRKLVELHIHLDGAIRPKTILEVAKRRKIKLPTKNDNQFLKLITCDGPTTLTEMLTKFGYFMPIVAGDRDAIRQIAYELVEDKANEKIVYFEARYSPHLLANCDVYPIPWKQSEGDLSPDEVVRLVNEGFEKGQRNFGIKVRSILSCLRHMEAWSPEVVELCKKYRKDGVVGLDLAGDESINYEPSRGHVQTYQEAVRCGIHRTVHAGEVGPPEVVREAVEILKAERIGHGYSIIKDAKLYQEILQKDIHLEACLYSSYITGACKADFSKHPVVRQNASLKMDIYSGIRF